MRPSSERDRASRKWLRRGGGLPADAKTERSVLCVRFSFRGLGPRAGGDVSERTSAEQCSRDVGCKRCSVMCAHVPLGPVRVTHRPRSGASRTVGVRGATACRPAGWTQRFVLRRGPQSQAARGRALSRLARTGHAGGEPRRGNALRGSRAVRRVVRAGPTNARPRARRQPAERPHGRHRRRSSVGRAGSVACRRAKGRGQTRGARCRSWHLSKATERGDRGHRVRTILRAEGVSRIRRASHVALPAARVFWKWTVLEKLIPRESA